MPNDVVPWDLTEAQEATEIQRCAVKSRSFKPSLPLYLRTCHQPARNLPKKFFLAVMNRVENIFLSLNISVLFLSELGISNGLHTNESKFL